MYLSRVPAADSPLPELYPEAAVGGYSRMDGTVEFYNRINALLDPDSEVLDFGAGRGQWARARYSDRAFDLQWLKGKVKRTVGADVDNAVLSNPSLDDAVVLLAGEPLPFEDGSFDVIIADYVLEHIPTDQAQVVAAELSRVLRPGGWLAARTPNRRGMIALGGRLVPNRQHHKVLRHLQPQREEQDVFPTAYAMNTRAALRRLFPDSHHARYVYGYTVEPTYFGQSTLAWRLGALINRLTPPPFTAILMVFVQKKS